MKDKPSNMSFGPFVAEALGNLHPGPAPRNVPNDRPPIILVVDDNPTDLKIFADVLASAGFDVIQTECAEDAMLALRSTNVDAIIVDILLPGVDGLSFARELKAQAGTRSLPIIASSASNEWPFARLAQYAGCTAFLQKPIDTRQLPGRIAAAIRNN